MQFTLIPSKNLPSEAQIVALEIKLQCALPASYREFLKKYNDARLVPLEGSKVSSDACIAIFAKPSEAYEAEWWFVSLNSLSTGVDGYGILEEYEFMADCGSHLPDLLAIARSGGVKFHLCVKGEGAGGIFMAGDRYTACIDEGRMPTLKDYTQICESFDEFLGALRWLEYDENGHEIVEPVR